MSITKRYISFLLALVLTAGLFPQTISTVSAARPAAGPAASAPVTLHGSTPSGLEYEVYFDHVEITDYDSENPKIIIPAEIAGLPVTSIGIRAFLGCTGLTSINIPARVTSIGARALENCLRLKTIRFAGDAPKFGYYVFYNVTATAYYPAGNPTWTSDVMKSDLGKITWVAYQPSRTKLKITRQPDDVTVFEGETATVSVSADGDGLTYKWYFRNAGDPQFYLTNSFVGNTYSVTMDKNRADRQVYCVITDRYGESVTTNTVTLKMLTPVTIIQQPVSVTVPEGKLAVVRTRAVGEGLSYKWYFKNAGDSRFYQTASFTGDTYSVTMDDSRAGRQVYCAVTDAEGNTVATEIVTLNQK